MTLPFKHLETVSEGNVTIVRFRQGCLQDGDAASEISAELIAFLEWRQPDQLVVDFHELVLHSDAWIAGLIQAFKRVRSYGGEMVLAAMPIQAREVFQLLHLEAFFQFADSVDAGIELFE